MSKAGRLMNTDEGPIENELPDPPPEDDTKLTAETGSPTLLAMRIQPTMMKDELPDPPPEDDTK